MSTLPCKTRNCYLWDTKHCFRNFGFFMGHSVEHLSETWVHMNFVSWWNRETLHIVTEIFSLLVVSTLLAACRHLASSFGLVSVFYLFICVAKSVNTYFCLKPGFYYPSWPPELTGDQFPLPVNTGRVEGRAFPLAELTVNSGRELGEWKPGFIGCKSRNSEWLIID